MLRDCMFSFPNRIGIYPERVRRQAWAHILSLLLGHEKLTDQLIQVLLDHRVMERQLFLRELAIHKIFGWCVENNGWKCRRSHSFTFIYS